MTPGGRPATTPYALLVGLPDRSRPLITHYAGPIARVELSVASVANAVAKAAGLLRDGVGLAPGALVSLDLPRHWQLPVWTMAALSVGCRCGRDLPGPVAVRVIGIDRLAASPAAPDLFAALAADDVLVSSCDAFGAPIPGGVAPGALDIGVEVRGYPDAFTPEPGAAQAASVRTPAGDVAWLDLLEAGPAATGSRLWVDEATAEGELLVGTAVKPLLTGGSVVIATGLDRAQAERIRAAERVSARA
jgi:uncharacterized protein (TIGR03089 family)